MKTDLKKLLCPTTAVRSTHAIWLFALLQVYFACNTLSFGLWKSSDVVFRYMVAFYGVWLAVLVVVVWLLLTLSKRLNTAWVTLSMLVVLSIPFSWDVWVQSLELERIVIRWAVCILLVPAIYLYFRIGLEVKRVHATACAVAALCVVSLAGHARTSVSSEKAHDFDTVEIDKKINVHMIMLDGFTHSSFAKEFMGVENPAADHLATLEDSIYAGTRGFAEHVPTMKAWATVFNLGRESNDLGFFSGTTPSRLTTLLRNNGYHIYTGYSGDFFGWYKGKHVDHYYRGERQSLRGALVCTTQKGMLGFCDRRSRDIFLRFFAERSEDKHEGNKEWPDTAVELIDRAERDATSPLFSAFYMNPPMSHTPWNYRHGDPEMRSKYKQRFVEGTLRAHRLIKKIDRLRMRYPESIFIVGGDHGPFLSRRAEKEERRFIVLDQHAVALALLNASSLCTASRDWLDRQHYLTPSRMLAASLACNGESRQLTEHFTDNEEFMRFGESFSDARSQAQNTRRKRKAQGVPPAQDKL